ncbi:MAG: HepT-like ribonuclease domain-containing protein [bacterium]
MSKRHPELFLIDILMSIDSIKRNVKNLSFDHFVGDEKIFKSTLQDLTVIGEAAKNLLETPSFLEGSSTEWRKIVDFRNVVVHKYFGIDYDFIYWITTKKIPVLEADIFNIMQQKKDKTLLLLAVETMKVEFTKLHRKDSLAYIDKIEKLIK